MPPPTPPPIPLAKPSTQRCYRYTPWAYTIGVLIGAFSHPGCSTSGLVGGHCAAGYSECNGHCVDLQSDDRNCGSCNHSCPAALGCRDGLCQSGGASGLGGESSSGRAGDTAVSGGSSGQPISGDRLGGSGGIPVPPSGGGGFQHAGAGGAAAAGGAGGTGATSGAGGMAATSGTAGMGATSGAGGMAGTSGTGGLAGTGGTLSCTPPFNTPAQCGDCQTRCVSPEPLCEPSGEVYGCVPRCTAPLSDCSGSCVDLSSNPFNCGRCGSRCTTGICQAGKCVGSAPGHIVAMCANFRETYADLAQDIVLGNALLLPIRNPIRILAYDEYAEPAWVAALQAPLARAATTRGRTYTLDTVSVSSEVPGRLNIFQFDVFLVHDPVHGTGEQLSAVGGLWGSSLDAFTRAGGTIVTLGSPDSPMPRFLSSSGLLPVGGALALTDQQLINRAPGDVIGVYVPWPFLASKDTCSFDGLTLPDANTTVVISTSNTDNSKPIIVHRFLAPQ